MSFSFKFCLASKIFFLQRSSSFEGLLSTNVFLHQNLASVKDCLSSKVVFHQKLSSIKGYLPTKIIFQQRTKLNNFLVHFLRPKICGQKNLQCQKNFSTKHIFDQPFLSVFILEDFCPKNVSYFSDYLWRMPKAHPTISRQRESYISFEWYWGLALKTQVLYKSNNLGGLVDYAVAWYMSRTEKNTLSTRGLT